jgi:hypothetical protein
VRRGVLAGLPGLVWLCLGCFERRPGSDRAPRSDAGAAVELRLVQPAHGAVVTRRRPLVRWRAGVGSPGWAVDFCADARCARVLQRETTAALTAAPSMDLPVGLVFWRVSDPTRVGVASPVRWFRVPPGAPPGAAPGYGSVASAAQLDADGDGRAEILYADGALRPGDGAEGSATVIARLGRAGVDPVIAAGDVDGDGFPDLAGITGALDRDGPSLAVWRGPVAGDAVGPTWRVSVAETMPDAGPPQRFDLLAGDFNGDGFRDLVLTSIDFQQTRGRIYVIPGGEGGPRRDAVVALDSPRGLGSRFHALAAADLDGDGADDLLAAASDLSSVAMVYRGTAAGLDPLPAWTVARGEDGFGRSGAIADLTGDGALDVALASPSARMRGCVYTFPWRAEARSLAADASSVACGAEVRATTFVGEIMALGDFDGDGFADLAAVERNESGDRLWTTPGDREGLFEGGLTALDRPGATGLRVRAMTAVELDDDGLTDLLVRVINTGSADSLVRYQGSPAGLRPWTSR